MSNLHSLPKDGFVRARQIVGDAKRGIPPIIPVSRSAWWAGVASGRYPKPVKLGPRTTAWRAEDIRRLVENLSGGADEK
ncbi:helix-turn-helix transcriptional regulator [Desulfocurvibacter africanus]|uniref:helix-turn-helix transcriptional regulator n=1 Tax=Desulfocurvibacter africanus TaxID=873 RepID=UPI0009DB8C6E|nr:AlpA family phage regulatory protein [Desulfocurvibacter africanus]